MTSTRPLSIVSILTGVLLVTGCPGDDGPSTDTEGTGTGTGDDVGPTTTAPTTTLPPMTTAADTTGMPTSDDGPTTDDGATTDTGTEAGTDTGTQTGDTTGGMPDGGYGPCATDEDCLKGEICIVGPASATFCAQTACRDMSDCATPDTGEAVVTCSDLTESGENICWLDCLGDLQCPDGMACEANVCAWPAPAICGGGEPLAECGDTAGGKMAVEETLSCDPADASFFFDIYEIEVTVGDCVFVSADNVGAAGPTGEPAADLVAFVVDAAGNAVTFDDELDCADPTFGGEFGCPQGSATAAATGTMMIGIAQYGGAGCPDPAPYTLTLGVNGADVDPGAPAAQDEEAFCG